MNERIPVLPHDEHVQIVFDEHVQIVYVFMCVVRLVCVGFAGVRWEFQLLVL